LKGPETNEQKAMRASLVTVFVNIVLTAFKFFAGVVGNSTAMIADALHSFSDMYTTFIVMIGVKLANRKADRGHPYGHERFECVAAIIMSVVLIFTGAGIGWSGIRQIRDGDFGEGAIPPGLIALVAAVATIAIKAFMFAYKRGVARKINSSALMADAWHHLSDSLSSIGSFVGILGARLGFPILDPLAAIAICLFIFKVAVDIFRDAVGKMTDKSCGEEIESEMHRLILSQESVLGVDLLRTRLFGDKIFVDVEIGADESKPLSEAHGIAQRVHDAIEAEFPKVKHCTVHVNPVCLSVIS